ncbi:MAG: TonB-dependent receptor [Flavisolibacter sp.]
MRRIAFFLGMIPFFAQAQQNDTTELLPVEVRAVRAAPTAPFAKSNLSKADIEKQNMGQDLPFLLNQTPSVVVNADAGNGIGYTGIRIRGTDASRINVTLNGVPFNDPESSGTFFVDLPDFASSVNSIQIQRGVGTSSNGAGSFGGTINLSTNELKRAPYFESNNSYGSFSSLKNTVKAGTGLLNDHFTADLRLSRISSNGYIDRAKSNLRSFYFSSGYFSDKTDLRLNVFSGKEKTYQAWNGVSEADLVTRRTFNSAGMDRPGSPYENETDNYQQDHYQFFWTQKFSPALQFNTGVFYIKGNGYYEQYKGDQKYSSYGLPAPVYGGSAITRTDLVRQLWLNNDFYGDIFSLQYRAGGTALTLGGAWTNYMGNHNGKIVWAEKGLPQDNYKWYDVDGNKNDVNAYAKWQQQLSSRWQFFADGQVRKVTHDIEGFRYNPNLPVKESYTFFNPKAGVTYQYKNWMVFASYSIAHKEPNRDDFEAALGQMPRPEKLNDLEVGLEKKAKNYNWGATVYYMKYKDQLVLTGKINDVGAYTRSNIDDSYRLGVELEAAATPLTWLRLAGNLALSRNKVRNFQEFVDDYDNGGQKSFSYNETDISYSPGVVGAATISFLPRPFLSFDLLSKYVGKQYLDNTSNENRKLNPYFTEDARVKYTLQKFSGALDLVLQVNNIFNKLYEPNGYTFSYYYGNELATENYYFPMAGTNWMVGLNLRF